MGGEERVEVCYQYNKDTRALVEAAEKRHTDEMKGLGARLDKEIGQVKAESKADFNEVKIDLKALVDKMANRLPPWVLFFISFLTLLVGGLLAKVVFN